MKKYIFLSALLLSLVIVVTQARVGAAAPEDASQTFIPLAFSRYDPTLSPPIFGVQMYGVTTETSGYIEPMADSNATWLRIPICWECTERSNMPPVYYDWHSVDAALAAAAFSNVKIIATITTSPAWAAPYPDGPLYPEDREELAEFIHALVERYDGDGLYDAPGSPVVRYWEFYNEPDAALDAWTHGWGDNGAEYAAMLEAVYPSVKSASRDAQVVFGGISHDWFEEDGGKFVYSFLDDVLQAGGGAYFDVMNFHYYPIFSHVWAVGDGLGLLEKTEFIRQRLSDYGLEKPFVITEAGWHSNSSGTHASTPEIQARYVVGLFVQSMAADVDAMIWWMLYDPGGALDNGLVTAIPNVEIKPSFTAFRTIVDELGNTQYQRPLTDEETGNPEIEAHQFSDRPLRRTVYVAWHNPLETEEMETFHLPARNATVRDIYGNTHLVSDSDDGQADGQLTLRANGRPLYVEVNW